MCGTAELNVSTVGSCPRSAVSACLREVYSAGVCVCVLSCLSLCLSLCLCLCVYPDHCLATKSDHAVILMHLQPLISKTATTSAHICVCSWYIKACCLMHRFRFDPHKFSLPCYIWCQLLLLCLQARSVCPATVTGDWHSCGGLPTFELGGALGPPCHWQQLLHVCRKRPICAK